MWFSVVLPLLCYLRLNEGKPATERWKRVVVLPDVHGDVTALLDVLVNSTGIATGRSLTLPNVVPKVQWAEGTEDTLLVSLGDLVDRGPWSYHCYKVMEQLAAARPGQVVRLFGNHEYLNLVGKAGSYIHEVEFDILKLFGLDRMKDYLSDNGEIGKMVLDNFELARVVFQEPRGQLPPLSSPSTLFSHAGFLPDYALSIGDLEEARKRLVDSLRGNADFRRAPQWAIHPDGPLWTRAFPYEPEEVVCPKLEETLAFYGAARMIVGHTPSQDGKIHVRCGGRVVMADTGMSRWMSPPLGNPAALDIRVDEGTVLGSIHALYGGTSNPSRHQIYPLHTANHDEL